MSKFNYWKFCAWYVVLVPVAGVLWWLAFTPAGGSSLAMPMKIHLYRPAGAVRIQAVWLMSSPWRDERWESVLADDALVAKWVASNGLWKPESFDDHTINFRVFGDDTFSTLGIRLAYAQDRHLLLIAELADGHRVGTIADIPDARTTKEMRVVLP